VDNSADVAADARTDDGSDAPDTKELMTIYGGLDTTSRTLFLQMARQ